MRSLDKHIGELLAFNNTIGEFDILTLSEIGSKHKKPRGLPKKNLACDLHYKITEFARGGAGLIIKEKYKTIAWRDLKIHKKKIKGQELEVENIWHEIKNNNDKTLAVIVAIYKHPGTSVDCLEYFNRSIVKIAEKNE